MIRVQLLLFFRCNQPFMFPFPFRREKRTGDSEENTESLGAPLASVIVFKQWRIYIGIRAIFFQGGWKSFAQKINCYVQ